MSDRICECGRKSALLAHKDSGKLVRWHQCRNHIDLDLVEKDGLEFPKYPPTMPLIFKDTDINKLHPKVQSALNWKPEGIVSGLLLHGTTGLGKTRGIWEIIRRLWLLEATKDSQMPFTFLTMRKLEGMIESSFSDQSHNKMIDGLITTPFLALDDFGKERLTSRMATDLFAIIDERSTAQRPTIISTNFNGTALLERFDSRDKELGVALIRRLKDYYRIVGVT